MDWLNSVWEWLSKNQWFVAILASIIVAYLTAHYQSRHEHVRIREELKLETSTEAAIIHLLDRQGWELRSFYTIKSHIRGFEDDELRRLLVRSGAIAFQQSPSERDPNDPLREDPDKLERWGLLKKNTHRLVKKT